MICIYWSLRAKKGQGIESGLKDEVALSICVPSMKGQSFGKRYQLITVPFSSVAQSHLTLCDPMDCSTPGFLSITSSWSLLKLMSIELMMPSDHLILCRPLLLLPSIFPSIMVFSNKSVLHIRWPKYWSFSFSISPSNEYSGLISITTALISLQSKGLSRIFSNITVQEHQIFGAQLSSQSNSHIHTWLLEKP